MVRSLAPISDPDLVIPTITQILGLREARDQSPLEHLKSALQEKKTLLLLDNFEQVVSAPYRWQNFLLSAHSSKYWSPVERGCMCEPSRSSRCQH